MGARWQRFVTEVSRFLTVGALSTLVALVLFNLLVHGFDTGFAPLNDRPQLAYLLANLVGMAVSFRGTTRWAFEHREARHADGGVVAFVLVNLVTLLIPMGCLWLSRNLLGLDDPVSDNLSANVVGLLLASAARFAIFHQLVFPHPGTPAASLRARTGSTGRSTGGRARPPAP